jgi:hypothetical protein
MGHRPRAQAPCEVGDVETVIEDGPISGHRGLSITCTDDLGDPRLSGTSIKVYNDDCHEGAMMCLMLGGLPVAARTPRSRPRSARPSGSAWERVS